MINCLRFLITRNTKITKNTTNHCFELDSFFTTLSHLHTLTLMSHSVNCGVCNEVEVLEHIFNPNDIHPSARRSLLFVFDHYWLELPYIRQWGEEYHTTTSREYALYYHIVESAASRGHFRLLQWIHVNFEAIDHSTFQAAIFSGNFEMLEWMLSTISNVNVFANESVTYANAMDIQDKHVQFEIINWILTRKFELTRQVDLHCFAYLLETGRNTRLIESMTPHIDPEQVWRFLLMSTIEFEQMTVWKTFFYFAMHAWNTKIDRSMFVMARHINYNHWDVSRYGFFWALKKIGVLDEKTNVEYSFAASIQQTISDSTQLLEELAGLVMDYL